MHADRRAASATDRSVSPAPDRGLALCVLIDNFSMLRDVYGPDVAASVLDELAVRLDAVFAEAGVAADTIAEPGAIRANLPSDRSVRDRLPALVDAMLLSLGSPVRVDRVAVVAAVSATIEAGPSRYTVAALSGDGRTRADMAVAVATLEAVAAGRLYFLFQSIAGAADPGQSLYQECFTRIVDRTTDDELQTPRGFIPALERLGLTRRFDRAVVEGGLAFLIANPTARVGCNISALSAVDDAWWAPVLERLAATPDLAGRLVIEITETAPRGDIDPILGFVRAFRRVGCRIAIDNFGAGFSSLRFAVAAAPDIIKIDACYVREQAADAFGSTYLGHLVGLARCLATEVVVVGIENDSDLRRARDAAANWVQGRHVAPASLFRGAVSRLVDVLTDVSSKRHRRRAEVLCRHVDAAGKGSTAVANG